MASSILSRRMDLIYLIFFVIHIPVVLTIDSYPLWPTSLIPDFMTSLRQFYITTYKDQFFVSPPPWFTFYITTEFLYHLPISFYAIYALLTGASPMLPVHLLVYAVQTGVTTATCIAEALGWGMLTSAERGSLMGLYVPYLGVSILMGVDMFLRLSKTLTAHARLVEGKKAL